MIFGIMMVTPTRVLMVLLLILFCAFEGLCVIFAVVVTPTLVNSLMALLLILFEHLTAFCILPEIVPHFRQCTNGKDVTVRVRLIS